MENYLSKRGYVIRKDILSTEELNTLRNELVGRPIQDDRFTFYKNVDNTFKLYIETVNKIYIPKIYGIKKFGLPKKKLDNYNGKDWSPGIEFDGELFPEQIEPTNLLFDRLTKHEESGGILSLNTGGGKTFCCLNVLSKLKKKTLIIVNKIMLMKQWEQEINKFLPEASVGFIQGQKNISINDKDIVIAMLQSLSRIDYPDAYFDEFGVVCIDEVHHISSPVFSKVLMKLCSKYTIGLSATPTRSDGCEYVFQWYLGDIVYKAKAERKGLHPIIKAISLSSSDYKEISTVNKITGQKQLQFTSMLSDLVLMPKRNKLIVEMIKDMASSQNRKILVLSDRREHLKTIKTLLDEDLSVTFTYGLFLGQMKVADLEKSKASQVILATAQCFGEGVSEKDLDTLFLITPKKFIGHLQNTVKKESFKIEQIVGRIFRKEHKDKHPMIVDLQDNFSVYNTHSKQRIVFYKKHFAKLNLEKYTINLDESCSVNRLKLVKSEHLGTSTNELPKQFYEMCQF